MISPRLIVFLGSPTLFMSPDQKMSLSYDNFSWCGRFCLHFQVHSFHKHIPKAKATTIAETPELKRIAENTKIQSNVKYHADFEKAKGKFTQIVKL
ncbi:conserved hypothetical protein [Culex quinquefasciatus]|uniref:Uncharacterized protein n=1 Tax=Culex quinquefasciatus TaxID=7176 RepID=B0W857_CULQU|nr:conserved hypothetical protein [Culex quinquefasciatus]|eukprot:XP_001844891.1 conserved hypothetical protein [Culex quinquefasciatus]